MNFMETALAYRAAGMCVLPAGLAEKRPPMKWGPFNKTPPCVEQIKVWFADAEALCIICGEVSGRLELIDFDNRGELFPAWKTLVESQAPDLLGRLYVESTQSGGKHVLYRTNDPSEKSKDLALRAVETPDEKEVEINGKKLKPKKCGNKYIATLTLIETKGQGGLVVCAPTPGYAVEQGDLTKLPVLAPEERDLLIESAAALNEDIPPPQNLPVQGLTGSGRPGDEYNERGDVHDLLQAYGWTLANPGENEYWRRPGKEQGWSATLKNRVFYVFSSNAAPFECNRAYSPFHTYTTLAHGGNFAQAAAALRSQGYGNTPEVNLSGFQLPKSMSEGPQSLRQLLKAFPTLRSPVIDGLLREGETMNVIASSKMGKSWLVIDLALAIACGRPWLGLNTVQGDVLILDNELHGETSANRIPKVAEARGVILDDVADRLYVENLRGRLQNLIALGPYFRKFQPGRFKLVILDAFYRFLPSQADENDNGTMANLYNHLDSFADYLKCSFVLIHHTSKGNQSQKEVTDVGAGAGAQSRATDTHLILRRHEDEQAVVMDLAIRSWPPQEPRCLRWSFPVWLPADDLDPTQLRQEGKRRSAKHDEDKAPELDELIWTVPTFVESFVASAPKLKAAILLQANEKKLSDHKAGTFLEKAEAAGFIHRWRLDGNRIAYATTPQPSLDFDSADEPSDLSKRQTVQEMLKTSPDLTNREIARRCDVSHSYVNRIRKELE